MSLALFMLILNGNKKGEMFYDNANSRTAYEYGIMLPLWRSIY